MALEKLSSWQVSPKISGSSMLQTARFWADLRAFEASENTLGVAVM